MENFKPSFNGLETGCRAFTCRTCYIPSGAIAVFDQILHAVLADGDIFLADHLLFRLVFAVSLSRSRRHKSLVRTRFNANLSIKEFNIRLIEWYNK